jgi:DNA-binding IscR family transcriptional regulator
VASIDTREYFMTEPMHQHEMIDLLWEYEQPFMRMEELMDWAEKGFRDYLRELTEAELKARYNRLQQISEQFSDCIGYE